MCTAKNIDVSKQPCYTCMEIQVGGDGMKPTEILRDLIKRSPMQQKDIAEQMGWSPEGASNRLRRGTISADEFEKMLGILGYEMKIVEASTSEEVRPRRKGVGGRLRMLVNGVRYDTYKADAICHSDESKDIFCELYRDDEGRYYVANYVRWEGGVSSISPIGDEDAHRLMKLLGA